MLTHGSAGTVAQGYVDGQKAVIKLYGPDCTHMYLAELQAYKRLASCQGKQIPSFLGAGELSMGIHYLASSFVEGCPVSKMALTPQVSEAVMKTLEQIQEVCHGFLHGDLHLGNMVCTVVGDEVRCTVIDFGHAKVASGGKEVSAEWSKLRKLLPLPDSTTPRDQGAR